jgi:hypothetical protein
VPELGERNSAEYSVERHSEPCRPPRRLLRNNEAPAAVYLTANSGAQQFRAYEFRDDEMARSRSIGNRSLCYGASDCFPAIFGIISGHIAARDFKRRG